jgi:hypothetical protein
MKTQIIFLAGLAALGALGSSAHAATFGAYGRFTLALTLTKQDSAKDENVSTGTRTTERQGVTTRRVTNLTLLEDMRVAGLLDGTVSGWSLGFVTPGENGDLRPIAYKKDLPAVDIPATYLALPDTLELGVIRSIYTENKPTSGATTRAATGTETQAENVTVYGVPTFGLRKSAFKLTALTLEGTTSYVRTGSGTVELGGAGLLADSESATVAEGRITYTLGAVNIDRYLPLASVPVEPPAN